jgi:hypothetical protein
MYARSTQGSGATKSRLLDVEEVALGKKKTKVDTVEMLMIVLF